MHPFAQMDITDLVDKLYDGLGPVQFVPSSVDDCCRVAGMISDAA